MGCVTKLPEPQCPCNKSDNVLPSPAALSSEDEVRGTVLDSEVRH